MRPNATVTAANGYRNRHIALLATVGLLAGSIGCGAELEGTYQCEGERSERDSEQAPQDDEESEATSDTVVISAAGEGEVHITSELFGELVGEITSDNTFSVSQEVSMSTILVGKTSVSLEAEGTVDGDSLTFSGTYESSSLGAEVFADFNLAGRRQ